MAFKDIFLRGGEITAQQQLNASYIESADILSPWADDSHLETLTFADVFGLTLDQVPINRSSAMSVASIAKGRNLICSSIARMPLLAVRNGAPLANQPTLLSQLQVGVPNFITLSWTIDALLFYGRSFWLITERTADSRPLHIQFVPESKAETKDGKLIKAFGKDVPANSYIRIDAFSEGFLSYGSEVIREAREIELAAREAGASPIPSIVLKQTSGSDLKEEEKKGMLAAWNAARRKRGGSVAFVNSAVDIEQLGQHAENLLIEGRNQAALQVARALGLPAWAVDATVQGASLNYSNQASRNRELLDALTPFIEAIQGTLSLYFPNGTSVKFDNSDLLKADKKGRYEEYAIGISAGFLTANEVRALENLAPLPEEQIAPVQEPNQPEETEQP